MTYPEILQSTVTQEERVLVQQRKQQLFIGVPKEAHFQENRVALTPESVALLVNNGHKIVVETGAGKNANFTDRDFSEAGAEIAYTTKRVFEANIIVKVAPLALNEMVHTQLNQIIFSALHLPTVGKNYLEALMQRKITALAYEYLKDEAGAYPIVRAISEIAGNASLLIAAEYLSRTNNGQGLLLGGISGVPPARVVILGAGVVGEFATRTALGLGAEVRVFDNSIYKLMRLQNNVNVRVFTSIINPNTLLNELKHADVAIGAIHSGAGRTPTIVTEEMVSQMRPGSVIVDVSIDQGGCFETSKITTHEHPVFVKHGVTHYCVPNIPSRVSKTASSALSHVLTPILLKAERYGNLDAMLINNPVPVRYLYLQRCFNQ